MTSRDKILAAVASSQPQWLPVPDMEPLMSAGSPVNNLQQQFADTLTAIGGRVAYVNTIADVRAYILEKLTDSSRIITTVTELNDIAEPAPVNMEHPQLLQDVDHAVIEAGLAVAENGAVWVTEQQLGTRVLPFICQHLLVILNAQNIVPTMHEAYKQISDQTYGFATFIAGPSKTADIEQSLVLGAHGARSMTVFLITQP